MIRGIFLLVGSLAAVITSGPASPASADGSTMYKTQSGKMRCFVSASEPQRSGRPAAVCETYAEETDGHFPQGPIIEYAPDGSGRANIVSVDDRGELKWDLGDLGGAQDTVMGYGQTYHANGWTILANTDGTRLTNDATGRGMSVSIDNVSSF